MWRGTPPSPPHFEDQKWRGSCLRRSQTISRPAASLRARYGDRRDRGGSCLRQVCPMKKNASSVRFKPPTDRSTLWCMSCTGSPPRRSELSKVRVNNGRQQFRLPIDLLPYRSITTLADPPSLYLKRQAQMGRVFVLAFQLPQAAPSPFLYFKMERVGWGQGLTHPKS